MAGPVVLVAAPNEAFRRSIVFLLASERLETDSHCYATGAFASTRADHAACAVIDDEAVENWEDAPLQFDRFGRPIILLVSLFGKVPDGPLLKQLVKPFLGEPLIKTVRDAIAGV
ncbi:hypothetical protein ACSBOB_27755 [Mesorhizobium sp. ASY16-5R]|uniref:hypothetical protein n=1 Tax=Mesorhizobium sp. ASY16-5R TaxID=3445772 RepID=UPI003F9ED07D